MEQSYVWDFKEFFETDELFEEALETLKEELNQISNHIANMNLENRLKYFYELKLKHEKLYTYALLQSDLDMSNQKYIQYKNQVMGEKDKIEELKNLVNEEILKINVSLDEYMNLHSEAKDYYMHFYEVLRLRNHMPSNQ